MYSTFSHGSEGDSVHFPYSFHGSEGLVVWCIITEFGAINKHLHGSDSKYAIASLF